MDTCDKIMEITNTQELRQALRNPYAWPGGYPTYIMLSDGEVICHDCGKSEYRQLSYSLRNQLRDGWRPVAHFINYEDSEAYCCHCNKHLESAHGDD